MGKTRTKQSLNRQFSAGGVVYRDDQPSREWLLIRPTGKQSWRLTKGHIDPGESSLQAAEREVEEEGGVEVEVLGKIGQDNYFFILSKERIYKIVTYFLMRYLQKAKGPISWETEEIAWIPFGEALERLTFKGEKEILQKAREMVESGE